jgi:neopullulanase
MGEDKTALKLCLLALMTLPGAPCIYYGDEIGLSAAGDPFCREAFPWQDQQLWDLDLLQHYKNAISLRRDHTVLRTGSYKTIYAQGEVYACQRALDGVIAIIIINASTIGNDITLNLPSPERQMYTKVWPGNVEVNFVLESRTLNATIPPRQGLVLVTQ